MKQFEEWFENHKSNQTKATEYIGFEQLPFSMKWGIYLEFFDSVNIRLTVEWMFESEYFIYRVNDWVSSDVAHYCNDRKEAQEWGIAKAFELLTP